MTRSLLTKHWNGESTNKVWLILICTVLCALGVLFYVGRDHSADTPIQAIEKIRGPHVDDIMFQKNVNDGQVIFYLKNINDGQKVVSAEFVKRTLLGWKWVFGGGHTLPDYHGTNPNMITDQSWSYQYFPSMRGTMFGRSPFPMLFGAIKNPDIRSIEVKDLKTGKVQTPEIVKVNGELRFWYAFVTEAQGKRFTLSAKSNDGKEIGVKNINEERSSQASAGTSKTD